MTGLDRFRAKVAELFGPQLDLLSSRYSREVPGWYREGLGKRAKVTGPLSGLSKLDRRKLCEANRRLLDAAQKADELLSQAVAL